MFIRRFMVAASMLYVLVPSFAQTESAAAGTPVVIKCSKHQAAQAMRSLTGVKRIKLRKQCKIARKSASVVKFWYSKKHRWMLHLRYRNMKCWELPLKGPEKLCAVARAQVREHSVKLAKARRRIEGLMAPALVTGNENHWYCIHRHEGAWNDTGAPYYGGLQMDWSFMSTYGPPALGFKSWRSLLAMKGTADRWTPREQMAVAEYARSRGRGYYPWPNTARMCGLI